MLIILELTPACIQAVKPARRCASVRASGPVSAVIVPEPRLHAALEIHPEVRCLYIAYQSETSVAGTVREAASGCRLQAAIADILQSSGLPAAVAVTDHSPVVKLLRHLRVPMYGSSQPCDSGDGL